MLLAHCWPLRSGAVCGRIWLVDSLRKLLDEHQFVLSEGAVIERLRRDHAVHLDPFVSNTALVTTQVGREILTGIYREYLDIGQEFGLPMILLSPTGRASPERLERAQLSLGVNSDAVNLLLGIKSRYQGYAAKIAIGGLIGCKGDAYHPSTALPTDAAYHYHQAQAEALAFAGVDFLIGGTLPAVSEALGMAHAMAETGAPYVISFVVRPDGAVLDGTLLAAAVRKIDTSVTPRPYGFMVNCVHPENFRQAMVHTASTPDARRQIIGLQANTSRQSPERFNGKPQLEGDDPAAFGEQMARLQREIGIRVLGGCCGTDARHIRAIAQAATGKPGRQVAATLSH